MAVLVDQGIPNKCAVFGQPFNFQIPANAFAGSNLVYTAVLNKINPTFNGVKILPPAQDIEFIHLRNLGTWYNWLTFSAGTFSGTPSNTWYHRDTLQVKVRATDTTDQSYIETTFIITMHEYVNGMTYIPMAKTAAECAYVVTDPDTVILDSETLGLQPFDTVGVQAGIAINRLEIKSTSGIVGAPIYLTNVGGKATIKTTSGTNSPLRVRGQDILVVGQGTPDDPYGFDLEGIANPGVQLIDAYQNIEVCFVNPHDTGFSGFSVKNTGYQRPMLTHDKQVKYFDGSVLRDPASEIEMNAITAAMNSIGSLENYWCVRSDIKAQSSIDPAYVKYLYRNGQWIINYHSDIQSINYVGRMTSTERDALVSPTIGDYVYCTDLRLYYIYNVCYDWVAYYDMININIHDSWGYRLGSESNTEAPDAIAGEFIYVGIGAREATHSEGNQYFPNGPHDIREFKCRNLYADTCGYDAFQFKNMPYKNNFVHRNYVKNYGRGTYAPANNIGIQDEGIFLGEGFSGYAAYNFAIGCGEVSPNGYQNNAANSTLAAFNVIYNNTNNGRIPIYIRREGLLEGVDPATVYNSIFFNTFGKFNGKGEDPLGTQYDDLIDVISRASERECANNLFAEIDPLVNKIAGITLNERNQVYSGLFEDIINGNYHPIGTEALNGYDLRTKDWGPLQNGTDGNGDPIVYDIYGNQLDWDNLKVGAAQASPIQELPTLQYYPNVPEPRFVTYDTGFDTGQWMIVYYPREYYQDRSKKFPMFMQIGGDGEVYGAGGQTGAETEAMSFGYLKNLNDDPDLDYEFIVCCPVAATNYGTTTVTNWANYFTTFLDSNPRIDRQRLYYGGLSNGADNPIFRMCGWVSYEGCAVVSMAPYNNSGVDITLVQNAHYWGVKDSADGGGNVVLRRDQILALPGRTAEAKATVYETMVGIAVHGAWRICYEEDKIPTLTTGINNNSLINTIPENTVRQWVLSKVRTDLPIGPPVPIYTVNAVAFSDRIQVSFENIATDATGFKILRKKDTESFIQVADVSTNLWIDWNGLVTGSVYIYKIISYNLDGDSTESPEAVVTFTGTSTQSEPIALAGIDQNITLPVSQIILNGSASNDPDGTIITYAWTKISGGTAIIMNPTSVITTVTGLEVGTYIFRLTVTDNDLLTDFDEITIIVNEEVIPSSGETGKKRMML